MLNWSFFIFIIHRLIPGTCQAISLSFFLSFFLNISSSNRFLFFNFSRCQSTKKKITRFLSFSDGIIIFLYELSWGRQLTVRTTDTSIRVSWQLTCLIFSLLDSTFPLPRITWAYWPIGIHPSNRSLVARSCLPVHTPILGKLNRQSVSTRT